MPQLHLDGHTPTNQARLANGCEKPVWNALVGHTGCRRCAVCRSNEQWKWKNRALLETAAHQATYFVTLTMRPRSPGWEPTRENMKKDLQDYLKRLRKKGAFRYLAAPEYGDTRGRFHWHLLIHTDDKSINTKSTRNHWKQGITHARKTNKRANYVTKYIAKEDGRKQASLKYGEAIKEHLAANDTLREIFGRFDNAKLKSVGTTKVPHKQAKRINHELHSETPKIQFTATHRLHGT